MNRLVGVFAFGALFFVADEARAQSCVAITHQATATRPHSRGFYQEFTVLILNKCGKQIKVQWAVVCGSESRVGTDYPLNGQVSRLLVNLISPQTFCRSEVYQQPW